MVSKPHLTQTRFHSECPLILMWASMVIPYGYVISFVRCVHYEVSYVCIPTDRIIPSYRTGIYRYSNRILWHALACTHASQNDLTFYQWDIFL